MRNLVLLIIIMNLLMLSACGTETDQIIAETSVGSITQSDLNEQLIDRHGEEILEEMLIVKVLSDTYDVSDQDIDQEVEKLQAQFGDQFEQWLEQQRIESEDELRHIIYLSLLQEEAVADHLNIEEEEMKQMYERLTVDIEAQHILVEGEDEANDIYERLNAGEDFNELANTLSIDIDADDGGYIGYFTSGDTEPEFEEMAYSMDIDDISNPVETKFGYHIIKVTDRRETQADLGSYEEMKHNIRRVIIQQKVTAEEEKSMIHSMLKKADVQIKENRLKNVLNISN